MLSEHHGWLQRGAGGTTTLLFDLLYSTNSFTATVARRWGGVGRVLPMVRWLVAV